MNLQSLVLHNAAGFQDLELQLDQHPLIIVSGRNHDSDTPKNYNGVGKSRLLSTLPNMLYESDPLALTKRGKKGLGADSYIQYRWEYGGQQVEVKQTAKSYHVVIDGQDLETHKGKQEVAKAHIQKMFPIQPLAFYSYAYLHTQRPHPFQRVSQADRLKYVTELFDLGIYDRLRQYFMQKHSAGQKAVERTQMLAEELRVCQTQMKAVGYDRDAYADAKAQINSLTRRLRLATDKFNDVEALYNDALKYEELVARIKELGKCGTPDELEVELERAQAYANYCDAVAQYKQDRQRLTKKLDGLPDTPPKQSVTKLHGILDHVEHELEQSLTYSEKRQALAAELEELGECEPVDYEEAQELRAGAQAILRIYDELHGECDCPTCGQQIDSKSLKVAAKRAEKDLEIAKQMIAQHRAFEQRQALAAELKKLDAWGQGFKQVKELRRALSKYSAELEAAEDHQQQYDLYHSLCDKLKELRKPTIVPEAGDIQELRAEYKAACAKQEIDRQLQELEVPARSSKKLAFVLKSHARDVDHARQSLDDATTLFQKLEIQRLRMKDLGATRKRLTQAIEELEPLIGDSKLYAVMADAYGKQNLKANAVQEMLDMISAKLNELAPLVFPEPFTFELKTSVQGVDARVYRSAEDAGTDIQQMSGAESNCFTLLWALTMIVFCPSAMRPNFIILDEPESNCSEGLREHIVRNFLPVLMDCVPHVIWITPLDTDVFGGAPRWTVCKRNGVSTVEVS